MDDRYLPLADSVRTIITRHIVGNIPITSTVNTGDTIIQVQKTLRLKAGDEIFLTNGDTFENIIISQIIDNTHVQLTTPTQFSWQINNMVVKGFNGQFIKAIYLGEPDVIPKLPAITVNIQDSDSEWATVRTTKEKYQIEIGVFVEDASQEIGLKMLWQLTDRIQSGLKKNVYPLVLDYSTFGVTANIAIGDNFIKVADSSVFVQGNMVLIEDTFITEENIIDNICDSTTIKLQTPVANNYSTTDTKIIVPYRFVYNSWPAKVTFGKIYKGTLQKGAAISWFAEEIELQLNKPWSETQLT